MSLYNNLKTSFISFKQKHPYFWAVTSVFLTAGLIVFVWLFSFFKNRVASQSNSTNLIMNQLAAPIDLNPFVDQEEDEALLISQQLLNNGSSLARRDKRDVAFKNTPLLKAIATGKFRLASLFVRHIVQNGLVSILNMQDQQVHSRNTPLILAIMQGQEELALEILQAGAKPHITASEGFSALHYACMLRFDKLIIELLNRGADPQQTNVLGVTPAEYYLYDFPFDPNKIIQLSHLNGKVAFWAGKPIMIASSDGIILEDINHIGHHSGFERLFNGQKPPIDDALLQRLDISEPKLPTRFSIRAEKCYRAAIERNIDDIQSSPITIKIDSFAKLSEILSSNYALSLYSLERSNLELSEAQLKEQSYQTAKQKTYDDYLSILSNR